MRPVFSYNVAIGLTSTVGARVTPFGITKIRVAATNDCYLDIGAGATPSASLTGSMLIRASQTGECFTIDAGDSVAVIGAAAGGTLNVTEVTS